MLSIFGHVESPRPLTSTDRATISTEHPMRDVNRPAPGRIGIAVKLTGSRAHGAYKPRT